MEFREEFSVCLNNETLSRVRVYLYKPFYSRERENAKLSLQEDLIKHSILQKWEAICFYKYKYMYIPCYKYMLFYAYGNR